MTEEERRYLEICTPKACNLQGNATEVLEAEK